MSSPYANRNLSMYGGINPSKYLVITRHNWDALSVELVTLSVHLSSMKRLIGNGFNKSSRICTLVHFFHVSYGH